MVDVAIVGGGAAGLATAIFTRRDRPTLSILVLEGAKKPGAKILVSGGARCNVTNVRVAESDFWGGRRAIVRRVLRALPVRATIDFFQEIGVPLHEEADGKLFPVSNRARDVLDRLLAEAAHVGVALQNDTRVVALERTPEGFRLSTSRGAILARAVVLATGGRSLPKSGSDGQGYALAQALGHTLVPTTPALVPLNLAAGQLPSLAPGPSSLRSIADDELRRTRRSLGEGGHPRRELTPMPSLGSASPRVGMAAGAPVLPPVPAQPALPALSGLSVDVELTVWIDGTVAERLRGSLLWTHFGISGPVVLNASRHWARADLERRTVGVSVNYFPGEDFEAVERRLTRLALERPRAQLVTGLTTWLPAALAGAVLEGLGIAPDQVLAHLPRDERRQLTHALTATMLAVAGTRGYTVAEATAGGIALDEIDPGTMESRVCGGLYLVGEVLDVDGKIGGFNFQWAWASGRAAARALARLPPAPSP